VQALFLRVAARGRLILALLQTFLRVESTSTWWWSDASGSMLGNCWAMAGSEGFIHISLAQAVRLRHLLAPTRHERAPR
jgi:hypothetical protein